MPYVSRDSENNITGLFEHIQPGIAEEEYLQPIEPPVRPNINGFKAAMVAALGGIVPANNLLKLYPMFVTSLTDMSWTNVSALVEDALLTSAITPQQYADFQSAFDANNIPITLP